MAVLPSSSFSRGRILQARHLHQNAVQPLALDQRLDGAEFVDAALDDLDRLFDRLPDAVGNRRLRHGEPDQPAAGVGDFEAALAAGAEQTAERLRQLAQLGQRGRQLGVLGDPHLDVVGAHRQPGIGDLGVAQDAADVVANLVELVLLDRVGIDLEQEVRTALQIEAEHEMTLRPFRPGLHPAPRERSSERRNRHTTSAVRMIASAFHRVKYNIELTRQNSGECARRDKERASSRTSRLPWRFRPFPWPARPWRGRPKSSAASAARGRRRRSRIRSGRRRPLWSPCRPGRPR